MDIIVNLNKFLELQDIPSLNHCILVGELDSNNGEFSLDIDTDEENDVYVRLIFTFDVEDTNIRIYSNGLDDSLRYVLLNILKEHSIEYTLE